jgi:hypothetical protein
MTATAGEQAGPVYLDSCVLLSLFLGDSGFDASETWLLSRDGTVLWISPGVLLEFAGVVATCVRRGQLTAERARWIESEFECFRQERLRLLEPRGSDFLQARQWLQQSQDLPLRSGDAQHCISPWPSATNSPWPVPTVVWASVPKPWTYLCN